MEIYKEKRKDQSRRLIKGKSLYVQVSEIKQAFAFSVFCI